MADNFSVKLEGAVELKRLLSELPSAPTKRALLAAIRKSAQLPLNYARALAPKKTGLLRKSLGVKLRTYDKSIVAVIGPRSGFKREAIRRKGRTVLVKKRHRKNLPVGYKLKTIFVDPRKYAHLVELGFTDRSGHFVPPRSFLRAAIERTKESVTKVTGRVFEVEILNEAGKLVVKHHIKTGQVKV